MLTKSIGSNTDETTYKLNMHNNRMTVFGVMQKDLRSEDTLSYIIV